LPTGSDAVGEISVMGFFEVATLRLVLWIVLPATLIVLLIGPRRAQRSLEAFWNWLWQKRRDPETILTQVVKRHEARIAALKEALSRSESAEREITCTMKKSADNVQVLEDEARACVLRQDDLGARAALYKLTLERLACKGFDEQLSRQQQHIAEARKRFYLLELQLRQYEVGRSILLSQLAEARTVEQQYAIADNFDPFNAIANWQQAEGMVQEKAVSARAVERVYTDLVEMPLAGQPAQVDSAMLDAQLAELKTNLNFNRQSHTKNGRNGHEE
jgi:phage shock protein A